MGALRKQLADAGRSLRDVFRNPGLRRIQLAWAGSIVGDWAYATGFSVYAYFHGGAAAVGIVAVVRYVLRALITPLSSMLGDRYPRRLVMIGSDLTAALVIVVGAILIWSDANRFVVFALAVIASLVVSPFRPAQASYLPQLANGPEELAAANVASSTIESVGFFAGPAIAGVLLQFASVPVIYVVDAATFAWSALLVLWITRSMVNEPEPPPEPTAETPEEAATGFLAEATAGFRVILDDRDLRTLVGLFSAQTVVAGASVVFAVAIPLGLLHTGQPGVGYLSATVGIGGVVGGFVALVLVQRGRLARDFGIGVFFWSAPLLLVAVWPSVATAALMMVLLGLANSVVDINGFTIIQRITPEETMSRVFGALESAFIGG